jgi:Bax protein
MNVGEILRSVKASLRGGWSPVGTVAIAVMVVVGLMALGVLHVYLKSKGIVLTAAVERSILVLVGPTRTVRARGIAVRPGGVERMRDVFADFGYDIARLRGERPMVPRVFVSPLPHDLKSVRPAAARKKLFVQAVLPQVLLVNELVLASRRRLLALSDAIDGGTLGWRDRAWLADLKGRYRVDGDDLEELIRRVDAVPVPLALAQAAIESGWGTSRFAREGNALFGQWTWARRGGLVPRDRDEGASHTIQAFRQVADSVSAYVRNLNTHAAYARFRKVRAAIRRAGGRLDSITLSTTLDRYSERGGAYVADLQGIIRRDRLGRFAGARLTDRTCRIADSRAAARRAMLVRVPRC